MSNINSDLLDDGLQAVMGKDRCQSDWKPSPRKKTEEPKKLRQDEAADASWEPVKTQIPMDKVKECTKWTALFAGISGLLFYWQQAGLLASEAAVPSFIVCALLAGLTIGWNAK